MGEIDIAVEDLFSNGNTSSEVCTINALMLLVTDLGSLNGSRSNQSEETPKRKVPKYQGRFSCNSTW